MARAYGDDLRCRILQAYERGGVSQQEVAERFGVSYEYVKKIRKQQRQNGQRERVAQARYGPVSRVTKEVKHYLCEAVRKQSDFTLWELQVGVQKELGVSMSKSLVWWWLQRWGLRRKKNRSMPRNKTKKNTSGNGKRGESK